MAQTPFTPQERTALVSGYADALKEIRQIQFDIEKPGGNSEAVRQRLKLLSDRLVDLAARYRDGLPSPALSRCPFSGAEMRHSFDPYGFDGPWWQRDNPVRPVREPAAGRLFLALTGAALLREPREHTEFLVVPGPAVPFVIPRVLREPQVRAVLSAVPVGPHRGYAVTYFAERPLDGVRAPTIWGTDWTSMDPARRGPDDDLPDMAEDFDFELERWVRAQKLLWIAPDDRSLALRTGAEGCPYLALSGDRKVQRLRRGRLWSA